MIGRSQVILICIISFISASVLTLFARICLLSDRQTVATVNVKKAVNDFSRALASNKNLSLIQKEQFTNQFASALKYSIQEYASLHDITILDSQSILAGSNDITANIEHFVQKKLTNLSKNSDA